MPKTTNIGKCSVNGCHKYERSVGYCASHYQLFRKYGSPEKLIRTKRSHHLYSIWFERKTRGVLCNEWIDFWQFTHDVGDRPSSDHYLAKKNWDKLYSLDNFEWKLHLKRREGESKKDWHARKWADKIDRNPNFNRRRDLQRRFGITDDQYGVISKLQNDVCAICKNPESTFDSKTGIIKSLAVDHCHVSGKIRKLLCFRCNSIIGRINESLELLDSMRQYLLEHNSTNQ